MKANFLNCTSIGILDHTGALEFKFMSLDNDLIVVENGFQVLHLLPLHAAYRSDSNVDISHSGLEII